MRTKKNLLLIILPLLLQCALLFSQENVISTVRHYSDYGEYKILTKLDKYIYSDEGLLSKKIEYRLSANEEFDPFRKTEYLYEGIKLKSKKVNQNSIIYDFHFEYDENGILISAYTTSNDENDSFIQITSRMFFTFENNLLKKINSFSSEKYYKYNDLNNILSIQEIRDKKLYSETLYNYHDSDLIKEEYYEFQENIKILKYYIEYLYNGSDIVKSIKYSEYNDEMIIETTICYSYFDELVIKEVEDYRNIPFSPTYYELGKPKAKRNTEYEYNYIKNYTPPKYPLLFR